MQPTATFFFALMEWFRFPGLIILCWLSLAPGMPAVAQEGRELSTTDRRAGQAYEQAWEAYRLYDHQAAIASLERAVGRDDRFIEAHLLLAEVHFSLGGYAESIPSFRQVIALDPGFFLPAFHYLGKALLRTGHYAEARQQLMRFLEVERDTSPLVENTRDYLARCEFAIKAIDNPVPFEPVNPGRAINSADQEYSPALTADEQTLIFTRKKQRAEAPGIRGGGYYEDFYISHFLQGQWTPAQNLGPPLNTAGNEGAQSLSADGRQLFFTACNRPGGVGSCDIYYSNRRGNTWSTPVNPGKPLNSEAWDSQPSISADGRTLYFASSREGSHGPMDLWVATLEEDGQWSTPTNMGAVINTGGRELSPFIHPDGQTLYFASDGHPGMGGLDIFYTRRNEEGEWTAPVNLGYPVNTHGDEFALIVGAGGETAWFASDMEGGYGGSDLYTFTLYPQARPRPVSYMQGVVADSETGRPLEAGFELIDVESGEPLQSSMSDAEDGSFLVPIPTGRDLALNVSKDGYLFFSEHFSYADVRTTVSPHHRDILLQPLREGHSVVLRNVFFETASHQLKSSSLAELEKLLGFMQENPGVQIEVSGHTDNVGSFEYNQPLSERRARSVVDFLTAHGIDPNRITYRGYADTHPVAPNDTEEGRALNRRTEFRVTGL